MAVSEREHIDSLIPGLSRQLQDAASWVGYKHLDLAYFCDRVFDLLLAAYQEGADCRSADDQSEAEELQKLLQKPA